MNERQKFGAVVLAVLMFLAGYLVGKNAEKLAGPPGDASPIKIGFIGPLSGDTANLERICASRSSLHATRSMPRAG